MTDVRRVLSFGGGVQTTALAVMVAEGEVETDHIVFADTGGEMPETYQHIETVNEYLKGYGHEIDVVRADALPLYEYTMEKSAPIPVRVGNNEGLGHRQCTRMWKITPILNYAKSLTDGPIIMQLGISWDEAHRMRESPGKNVTREWPLIDRRMTREDCRRVTLEAGLPEAPKSACYYCPLLPPSHFKGLAAERPELFEKAVILEDRIIERRVNKGQLPAYLTRTGKSLRNLQGQVSLFGEEAEECEGTCFV